MLTDLCLTESEIKFEEFNDVDKLAWNLSSAASFEATLHFYYVLVFSHFSSFSRGRFPWPVRVFYH